MTKPRRRTLKTYARSRIERCRPALFYRLGDEADPLALDVERAVERRRANLPCQRCGQCDDLVIAEVHAQPLEDLIGYGRLERHRVSVRQRGFRGRVEQVAGCMRAERAQLRLAQALFSAHGRVDLDSEAATQQAGNAQIQ